MLAMGFDMMVRSGWVSLPSIRIDSPISNHLYRRWPIMAAHHHNPPAPVGNLNNKLNNPASWLKPDEPLLSGGYDWSWCYVVFRDIPGAHGYCASSCGDIWSSLTFHKTKFTGWHKLKPARIPTTHGRTYLVVDIRKDGIKRQWSVHSLILEAFIGRRPEGMEGCHFPDPDPTNNNLSNLRWDTPSGNNRDKVFQGTHQLGSKNPRSKLVESDIPEIRQLSALGWSKAAIARRFSVSVGLIRMVLNRKIWTHVP
jgi:hypothetical protein